MMAYDPADLRRHIYFEKSLREFVAIAYYELPEKRLVMAIKRHKSKSMAVQLAMRAAKERTLAGECEESRSWPTGE